MAGLLDIFDTEGGRLGLGLLAAGSARSDGAGAGQRLMEAFGSVDQWKKQQQAALEAKQMQEFRKVQMEQYKAHAAQQAAAQQEAMAAKQEQARINSILPSLVRPASQGAPAMNFDQFQPNGTATGLPAQPGIAPSDGGFNMQEALRQRVPLKTIEDLQKLTAGPEYSPEVRYDQEGKAFVTAKNGSVKYLEGIKSRDELVETDLGGTKGFRTKYSPAMISELPKTLSPDSKASNALGWANHNTTAQRLNWDMNGGGEGGASQAGLNKQFGKPQAGYRWKADGSLEFIPGGPADQKAQAQKGGEGTVGGIVADLRDKYTQLDQNNGIVSTNNRFGTNMGAAFGASAVGQKINGVFGTQTQSARDSIAMTRPLLLQAIMKATGMSAKQMDSNAELKLYLATATDPQKGLEANLEALDRIESLFAGGNEKFKANRPQASTVNGWSMQKVN